MRTTDELAVAPAGAADTDRLVGLGDMVELFGVQPQTPRQWRQRGVLPKPDEMDGRSPLWRMSTLIPWWDRRRALTRPGFAARVVRALDTNVVQAAPGAYAAVDALWDDPYRWVDGREVGERLLVVGFYWRQDEEGEA